MDEIKFADLAKSAEGAGSFLELLVSIRSGARSICFHNTNIDTLDYSLLSSDALSPSRESLDVSDTRLGKAELLRNSVMRSQYLMSLSLMNNALGDNRGVTLINGIAGSKTLVSLSIVMNELGKKSAAAVADTLRANRTLTYLDLSYNPLGVKGGQLLAEALLPPTKNRSTKSKNSQGLQNSNTTLAELVLVETRIGEKGGRMLADAMQKGCGLISLALEGNGIHSKTMKQVEVRAKQNYKKLLDVLRDCGDDETVEWNRASCMVLGNGRVGKTSLIRALTDQAFVAELDSTKGIVLNSLRARPGAAWLFATEEDYTDGLLYRLANAKLSERVATRGLGLEFGKETKPLNLKDREAVTHGAKGRDVVKEEVGVGEGEQGGRKSSLSGFIQGRTREGSMNVTVWDFGGQDCFHVSHHLFWSSRALYLLVFNLRLFQLGSVHMWFKLLRLYTPDSPVLIVGTFGAQFERSVKDINDSLRGLDTLPEHVVESETGLVFAVDNETMEGIKSLKRSIETTLKGLESLRVEIPLRWTKCLDGMIAASKDRGWISLDSVYPLAQDAGVEGREVAEMLATFHGFGAIIHFTSSTYLVDTVTTNPQWLVDAIASIIHNTSLHKADQDELEKKQLLEDYERFSASGLASRSLLESLWSPVKVDFLLELTKRLLLISEWPRSDEAEKLYLVPAMAPLELKTTREWREGFTCVVDFSKSLLPPGLFARLVCCCIALSASNAVDTGTTPVVSKSVATFCLDHAGEIEVSQKEERLVVVIKNAVGVAKALRILMAMLRKIKEDFQLGTLEWETFVQEKKAEGDAELLPYSQVVKERKSPWFEEVKVSGFDFNLGNVF